jgi:hypothetical protein
MFGRDRRILNTVESPDALAGQLDQPGGSTITHKREKRIFFAVGNSKKTVGAKSFEDRAIALTIRNSPRIGLQSLLVECLYKTALIDFAQQTVVDK